MAGTVAMAKKRGSKGEGTASDAGKVPGPKRPTHPILSIRGSLEWKAWLERLADFRRLKAADLVDQALVEYAQQHGFDEPPPKR